MSTNHGVIYLKEKTDEGSPYKVRGFDGLVKHGIILWSKLPEKCTRIAYNVMGNEGEYEFFLSAIINQIAEAGYIYSTEQIQELSKLSKRIVKANSEEKFENAYQELAINIEKNTLLKSINFTVLKALYRFRNYLEPKKAYETGNYFNRELLRESFQLYDQNFEVFGNKSSAPKNVLSWQKIVGLTQRVQAGVDAQLMAQGLYDVLLKRKKFLRSFKFTHSDNFIFPADSDLTAHLGYNVAVLRSLGGATHLACREGEAPSFRFLLEILSHTKKSAQQKSRGALENKNRLGLA